MFRLLISVSGVGAATARMMLSSLSVKELGDAIASQDAKMVQRVKGVGAKTAQRIVLELQDKVSALGAEPGKAPAAMSQSKEEALGALVMLGFPKAAADKVLQSLDGSLTVEELIKEALKRI
jgi:Holliday junction DNA helicase RuvA